MHSVTDRQTHRRTDRQTDDSVMPVSSDHAALFRLCADDKYTKGGARVWGATQ